LDGKLFTRMIDGVEIIRADDEELVKFPWYKALEEYVVDKA